MILTFLFILNFAHATEECWTQASQLTQVGHDVPYQKGTSSQKLDVYIPSNASPPFKTVLSLHGGCFQWGSKSSPEDMAQIQRFTNAGYAVVSVDYRLADPKNPDPRQRNLFPASLEDAQDAARWLRTSGSKYHLETDRFVVFGYSAGATLAAYLGTRPLSGSSYRADDRTAGDNVMSEKVAGVIDFFGRTDFAHGRSIERRAEDGRDCSEVYLGERRTAVSDPDFEKASVLNSVDSSATRFLIVHGTKDTNVSIEHSELLYNKLRQTCPLKDDERDRKFHLVKIEGADHMFLKKDEMNRAWSNVCTFLSDVLGPPHLLKAAESL